MMCGCAQQAPISTSSTSLNRLSIPAAANASPLIIISPNQLQVSWSIISDNTNMPQANVEFDVERRDKIEGEWYLFCRTNTPPVLFLYNEDQGYFRVGAHWITEP